MILITKKIKNIRHPAIIMVDTISSLGSIDYQHDNWDVDVTVAGSQKGLMLPPGIAFNFISRKALEHSKLNSYNRSYWDWGEIAKNSASGFFPYTPCLLYTSPSPRDGLLSRMPSSA